MAIICSHFVCRLVAAHTLSQKFPGFYLGTSFFKHFIKNKNNHSLIKVPEKHIINFLGPNTEKRDNSVVSFLRLQVILFYNVLLFILDAGPSCHIHAES